MSMFDPQAFLDSTINTASDTKMLPIPEGEYIATVQDVAIRTWQGKKDPTQSGVVLDVTWEIDNENLRNELKRKKLTVRQGVSLDLLDDGSALSTAPGANIGLGRLREAVGKNRDGEAFSFRQLIGCVARVSVKHRIDGDDIYDEVKKVAAL